ncbi:hypothetical protein [Litoreibacter arenae]|uniref:Uncharacterized protein n=1 Tax=Litoreibacter arenae DSM 19593 TaxID=1123360 RepID=S9QJV8_9RHOB|nr:hypothetical protein [Litoreibacter arenae]EPX80052.1 hypothetical protein thalar_01388 [Litoreibacter arenae DSM 19593]
MKWFAFLALLALPAGAETKMSAAQFDAFTKDTTVFFNRHGAPYGAEQYLSDRRVIWSFLDGTCQRGIWFGERDEICFLYDDQPDALCWYFFDDGTRQTARVVGDDPADDLVVVGKSPEPLVCPGPDVGVSYRP